MKYRKVYTRLWSHPQLASLAPLDKLLALYLLTTHQSNRVGLYRFSLALASEELQLPAETLAEMLPRVLRAFEWHYDARVGVVWIPSWLTWNPPENPNVVKGLLRDLDEVPRTRLLQRFAAAPVALNNEWCALFQNRLETVARTLRKPSRNQEP